MAIILQYNSKDLEERQLGLFEARETDDARESIRNALEEWRAAQNYFENVCEPDLIDFAIYDLEAARRKYMHMLKKMRTDEDNGEGINEY